MIRRMAALVIVGGGYSGVAAGVQLARATRNAVPITIVEPRAELGRGLAYATLDPDHRLNGPLDNHLVDPGTPDELVRWCEARGVFRDDREIRGSNGALYLRRGDFGAHVGDVARATPCIRHHRASATKMRDTPDGFEVLAGDDWLGADIVIIATGNGTSSLPRTFAAVATHAGLIANPFDSDRTRTIPAEARVLLVGSGLTALDVASTLIRRNHRGRITALSRHGVRPRPPRDPLPEGSTSGLMDRIDGEMPAYVAAVLARHGGARALSRALRRRIEEAGKRGDPWQPAFDELRNSVWRFWPHLALVEKRRFLRHLRTWYDAHRFRTPPQNASMAHAAERDGRLVHRAGRIRDARSVEGGIAVRWTDHSGVEADERFDVVINCTGLDPSCGAATNPFLADLLAQGRIVVDGTGFGFAVDALCRPIGSDGAPAKGLRMIGPPTAGTFGDPLGVPFIAPQVRRMVPSVVAELAD